MIARKSFNEATITDQYNNSINNSINFHNASMFDVTDNGEIVETSNLLRDKYYHRLCDYIKDFNMDDKQFKKYLYRPKLLSFDLYGDPDYWYLLLLINEMSSITQFSKKNIKVLDLTVLSVIKEILTYEEDNVIKNKNEVEKKLNEING